MHKQTDNISHTELACCKQCKCVAEPSIQWCQAKLNNALTIASENGHFDCVDFLLKLGADKNTQEKSGCTALMMACIKRSEACVDLLKMGAEMDTQNKHEMTALIIASFNGNHVVR